MCGGACVDSSQAGAVISAVTVALATAEAAAARAAATFRGPTPAGVSFPSFPPPPLPPPPPMIVVMVLAAVELGLVVRARMDSIGLVAAVTAGGGK